MARAQESRESSHLLIAPSGKSGRDGKRGAARRGAARLMRASRASAVRSRGYYVHFRARLRFHASRRRDAASRAGLRGVARASCNLIRMLKMKLERTGHVGVSLSLSLSLSLSSRFTCSRYFRVRDRGRGEDVTRGCTSFTLDSARARGEGREGKFATQDLQSRGNGRTIVTNHCTFRRRASLLVARQLSCRNFQVVQARSRDRRQKLPV